MNTPGIIIRNETAADQEQIRKINIAAFAEHPFSRQTEHLIVDALRLAGALTISLVADADNELVGYIAFSPALIDGIDCGWFLLGPVAVLPARQQQGIGKALIDEGLKILRRMGATGCVLVGDPAYYTRLGFTNNHTLTVENVPPQYVMCMPLSDGAVCRGAVTHHPAFLISQ